MQIDGKVARRLALLSSIDLSDAELASVEGDLKNIVEYISELGSLDTSGVEPTYQVTGLSNVWREDEIEEQLPREELLELASERTTHAVRVPKVL